MHDHAQTIGRAGRKPHLVSRRDAFGDRARVAGSPPQQHVGGGERRGIGGSRQLLPAHESAARAEQGDPGDRRDCDEADDERAAGAGVAST